MSTKKPADIERLEREIEVLKQKEAEIDQTITKQRLENVL